MKTLEPKHWAVIAGLITGVATQLLSAQHGWADIATPGFVAGLLIQVASAITAIFVGAPGATAALERANLNTDLANATTRAVLADPVDLGKVDPKRFIAPVMLLACLTATAACSGSPRHLATVADQSAYETLADTHALEQEALCGLPSCKGSAVVEHEKGWTLAKSQAFNKKLLPAVEAGRQFNTLLATWKPGMPTPQAITDGVGALGASLAAVTADFPPGPTRNKILADIGQAQGILLNAFQIVLLVKGGQ